MEGTGESQQEISGINGGVSVWEGGALLCGRCPRGVDDTRFIFVTSHWANSGWSLCDPDSIVGQLLHKA